MKRMIPLALCLTLFSGCVRKASLPEQHMTTYDVTMEIKGTFAFPETDLGAFEISADVDGPARFLFSLGGAWLKSQKKIKAGSCSFTPVTKVEQGHVLVIKAGATCTIKDLDDVTELLTIKLSPSAP